MYRVMLIDDEESARSLLRTSIDWAALGMVVAGEAGSGVEAINVIDEIRPDLAIVDISMPFMNGIEFTQIATIRYPDLMIIILTAFDDFEYARQCIRLPVFEYMLKPIVRTEVTETLRKVRSVLDEHCRREQEEERESEGSSIAPIVRYIEENFTDSRINLTSVAQMFGFSPSYLSRKFKSETGSSLIEYLTKCRMEKAIELADGSGKMFCTASAVGIPDPNYFGRCFKKYTGVSYSEYAARQAGKQPPEE